MLEAITPYLPPAEVLIGLCVIWIFCMVIVIAACVLAPKRDFDEDGGGDA